MILDKFILMKILQSKGIISYDEWNYNDIAYYIEGLGWPTSSDYKRIIKIQFPGVTEIIPLDEYNTFKRDITIDNILK